MICKIDGDITERQAALIRDFQQIKTAQQCSLPGARWPNNDKYLSMLHFQINTL